MEPLAPQRFLHQGTRVCWIFTIVEATIEMSRYRANKKAWSETKAMSLALMEMEKSDWRAGGRQAAVPWTHSNPKEGVRPARWQREDAILTSSSFSFRWTQRCHLDHHTTARKGLLVSGITSRLQSRR